MSAPRTRRTALLTLTLLALAGCRVRGTAEADTSTSPHPASAPGGGAEGCSLYVRDAQLDVTFAEEPRAEAEYDTGDFARKMRVSRHERGAHRRLDRWTSVLHFDAERPANAESRPTLTERSVGELHLETVVPWDLAPLDGRTLHWQRHRKPELCATGGENAEPRLVAEDVLRGERGELLFLGASAPTAGAGAVLLAKELTPEVEVSWVDAGCAEADTPEGTRARPVALRVTSRQGAWTAPVGARTAIRIGEEPYVVAVSTASIGADGHCETAAFMLYRQDVLVRTDAAPPLRARADAGMAEK